MLLKGLSELLCCQTELSSVSQSAWNLFELTVVLAVLLYAFSLAFLSNELTGTVHFKSLANVYLK